MSAFLTKIPIDLEAIKKLLPANHYIEGITFNKDTNEVELTWSHHLFVTPFTFAQEYPISLLSEGKTPESTVKKETLTIQKSLAPETKGAKRKKV